MAGEGIILPGQDGGDKDWCRGNGVDVSSDGTVVFSAGVKKDDSGSAWPNRVIYLTGPGGQSGGITQLTTGYGPSGAGTGVDHAEPAMLPHISDNANWVSFTSKSVYGDIPDLSINCRPPFSAGTIVGTTANPQLWRYNVTEEGTGDEYFQGWITQDTYFKTAPASQIGFQYEYLDGFLTNSGEVCVFSVLSDGGDGWDNTVSGQNFAGGNDIMNIGFAMLSGGGTWKQGMLTRSDEDNSFCGGRGKLAIHTKGTGLPEIIFLTNVYGGFGLSPDGDDGSGTTFDVGNQRNTTNFCHGSWNDGDPDGGTFQEGWLRLVYLSTPNSEFKYRELIKFRDTTDRKRFGNLEWSKDGKEIVFSGKFNKRLEIPNSTGGSTTLPADGSDWNDKWAVFRMSLGTDPEDSGLDVNCTFDHVMPSKATDYKNDGQVDPQPKFLTGFVAR